MLEVEPTLIVMCGIRNEEEEGEEEEEKKKKTVYSVHMRRSEVVASHQTCCQ